MMRPARAAVLLVFALFTTVGAWAEVIYYIDGDGYINSHEATVLTGSSNPTTLDAGWYYVAESITYNGQLQFSDGDVHLILCNDATLTINSGSSNALQVNGNLNIYYQTASYGQGFGALVASSGASGGSHAGIHANNNGNITINGGNITATSSAGYGISTAGIITINSGTVHANRLRAHAINLSWYSDEEDQITATSYLVEKNVNLSNIPSVITANKPFKDSENNIYSGILTTAQISAIEGKTLYPLPSVLLYNDEDNIGTIGGEQGLNKNVCLQGRTLFKDGAWNTLCLPFSLNSLEGTPLAGATLKELKKSETGFDPSNGTLYLNFQNASRIEAGKPYIIKWDSGDNIVSPVFTGVTLTDDAGSGVSKENDEYVVRGEKRGLNTVEFRGSYSPVALTPNDKSVFFLGTRTDEWEGLVSTLYYPNAANHSDGTYHLNACRAYFWVDLGDESNVSAFVLDFGEGETGVKEVIEVNGVSEVLTPEGMSVARNNDDRWFTLDGRRLSGKPTQPGIYIIDGRKVVKR